MKSKQKTYVDTIPLLTQLLSLFDYGTDHTFIYNALKKKFPANKISFREILNIIENIEDNESCRNAKISLIALIGEMDRIIEEEEKAEIEKEKKAKLQGLEM